MATEATAAVGRMLDRELVWQELGEAAAGDEAAAGRYREVVWTARAWCEWVLRTAGETEARRAGAVLIAGGTDAAKMRAVLGGRFGEGSDPS